MTKFCDKERDLSCYLWRMNKLWQAEILKVLKGNNVTHIQLEILGSILNLKDLGKSNNVTQIQISKFSGIDPMSTSTQLRILEKNGFIKRTQSEIDTRSKYIEVTEAALDLCCEIQEKLKKMEDELFALQPQSKQAIMKEVKNLFNLMLEFSNREDEVKE